VQHLDEEENNMFAKSEKLSCEILTFHRLDTWFQLAVELNVAMRTPERLTLQA